MEPIELDFPEGKIVYGDVICLAPRSPGQRHSAKLMAVAELLASMEGHYCPWYEIRLATGALGKPRLSAATGFSPAVSFSWEGEHLWAALSIECTQLGIDAALPQDFSASYPFGRVFGEGEWRQITTVSGFEVSWRAAMLWSIKEAAAKMLGCGFHFVDPRSITVSVLGRYDSQWHSSVILSIDGRAIKVRVYSKKQSWGWISFALGNTKDQHVSRTI